MARTDTLPHFLEDLADAMRTKTGESGTIQASDFDTTIAGITTPPTLQDKQVTITENTTTTIEADSNYDGLGVVEVTTNVSGGSTPTKGIVIKEHNSDGWVDTIELVGFTSIPNYYLGVNRANAGTNIYNNAINRYLKKIILNDGVESLGDDCFRYVTSLQETNLPNTIKTLGARAFYFDPKYSIDVLPNSLESIGMYCFQNTSITIKTIPDTCTSLNSGVFNSCSKMVQISMNNIIEILGNATSNAVFGNCTLLKGVWIGSAITGIERYAFGNCTNLKKIYINLPRATVEAMGNYNYAFMNDSSKVGIIVCNDDPDFITKTEFDAIDWATQ